MFANGPGDRRSIPGHAIPKTLKMVLDTSLFNTQQYKVRIKGKVEQSWERSITLLYTLRLFIYVFYASKNLCYMLLDLILSVRRRIISVESEIHWLAALTWLRLVRLNLFTKLFLIRHSKITNFEHLLIMAGKQIWCLKLSFLLLHIAE